MKIENLKILTPGRYRVIVITRSQLKIEAQVNITGLDPAVRISIKATGKILFGTGG
jgi:hypothetical protein